MREDSHQILSGATEKDLDMVTSIKEAHCFVAEDFDSELGKANSPEYLKTISTPERDILLGRELFQATEGLFQPSFFGAPCSLGILEAACLAMKQCLPFNGYRYFRNVIITGMTARFPGLVERLKCGIEKFTNSEIRMVSQGLAYEGWAGGSIVASLNHCMWKTKEVPIGTREELCPCTRIPGPFFYYDINILLL
jgi:hypothetical protein